MSIFPDARTEADDPAEYLSSLPGGTRVERVACAGLLMALRWGPAGLETAVDEMLKEFEIYGYMLIKT